jgi:hypothetical protein
VNQLQVVAVGTVVLILSMIQHQLAVIMHTVPAKPTEAMARVATLSVLVRVVIRGVAASIVAKKGESSRRS